jgi:hypothetical protein
MRFIISNANGNTIEGISKRIGVKPKYIESILTLLLDLGIVDEQYGRYYIRWETRCFYETMIEKMIWTLESSRDLKQSKLGELN